MAEESQDQTEAQVEVGGLGFALSADALRALLDPATREEASIDLDLTELRVSVPTAAVNALLAGLLPQGDVSLTGDGVTIRPGDGAPGIRVRVPLAGVRVRVDAGGVRVNPD